MPKKPRVVLPLLLLASTTLAIGAIVYGLLWREANRLHEANLLAANNQAATVVENVALTVGEIKTAVMESLLSFEGPNFSPQLSAWQQRDPFVTFAFSWSNANPENVSLLPQDKQLEPHFGSLIRPEAKSWIWEAPVPSRFADAETASDEADDPLAPAPSSYNFSSNSTLRQEIRSQSQRTAQVAKSSFGKAKEVWISDSTQWIHSSKDGESYWIGIASWNKQQAITGAAIRMGDLASVLQRSFPNELAPNIESFVLRDPSGKTVASTPNRKSSYLRSEYIGRGSSNAFSLGSELPGWTLHLYTQLDGSLTRVITSAAGIGTSAILLTLACTGLWLVWQSRASQLDAARKVSFVSNVSHELKTPLTTIRMYSELLQSGRVKEDEKRIRYLDTISGESQRLTRLVNNVLDFSRLDRRKAKLNLAAQAIDPVLQSYLDLRQGDLSRAGFALETELQLGETPLVFDRDALCQIVGNLVDNSLKYAKQGAWIRIRSHRNASHAFIEFSDQGPGLPKHLRKKTFQAFKRGDDSLTAESSGFGLGLSIAQTLANEMGAKLTYQHPKTNRLHPTFVLEFPISDFEK
ncbi:HAMP domain-containing histidine kinase [Pelagicoccus sp. NFK12]|uniref:histidine kinase n=1 Tax=Pelagicoccus enzymogenes TaxID=2773457 RepID=A0A927F809_9BACT|nr:HAMP domain-containing sensor histidine kinase [Pelagicoccus enzymogenes]MBD5778623.1 HAMP domain-containing histidine kinase [Pelagicoccus enzymogenes]